MASSADAPAKHDPTSPFVREVLDLYRKEPLAKARFPDLDCDVLLEAQRALHETQLELERCEAQLAAAREALVGQLESIESKAERALAYARVFAIGDPELTARLAEVERKKPAATTERAPPRRRGRPKKDAEGAELFADAEAPLDAEAVAAVEVVLEAAVQPRADPPAPAPAPAPAPPAADGGTRPGSSSSRAEFTGPSSNGHGRRSKERSSVSV